MAKARKPSFARLDVPPPLGQVTHILKVTAQARLSLVIVSSKFHGYWTHWDGRRTRGCRGDKQSCKFCADGVARRWAGFLHVIDRTKGGNFFLELTTLAAQRLLALVESNGPLKGMHVHLWREGGNKKSPIQVDFVARIPPEVNLPAERDPDTTLARLWTTEKHD